MRDFEDPIEKDFDSLLFDVKYDREQFKDPATIGLLLYRLAREREQTNKVLEKINIKLNQITQYTNQSTLSPTSPLAIAPPRVLLPPIDKKILEFVAKSGNTDAESVRKKFKYKGRNAASARLNALCVKGILKKTRVGKKVVFEVQG